MIVPKTEISKNHWGPDLSAIPVKLIDFASVASRPDDETYTVQIHYPEEINGVPMRIDADQGEILLLQMGLLDALEAQLQQEDMKVQIRWKRSQTWLRYNAFIIEFAAKLGMTDEQLDDFFIQAKKI
jgi:hypothetical protein